MNEYEYDFDYLNYISNIPKSMNYSKINTNFEPSKKADMNFMNYKQTDNNMTNNQISEPNIGWIRGNMFPASYNQYKNYKPAELDPKNEREALLYQIMQYKFAMIDLNLYLDTHPNDNEAISLYNKYLTTEKQMRDKYESMYGPLTLNSNYLNKNGWVWKNSPWPWEVI